MKIKLKLKLIALLLAFVMLTSVVGVYATWAYAEGDVSHLTSNLLTSLFPWTDLPDEQMNVSEKYLQILNSVKNLSSDKAITINGVTYTDTYEALIAIFEMYNTPSVRNDSYIGTMQDSGEDIEALLSLFDAAYDSEMENNPHYSMMLKRESLDGDNATGIGFYMNGKNNWVEENKYYMGNEMVLFSTDVEITDRNINRQEYITVYAVVYTLQPRRDANGNPIQKTYNDGSGYYPVYHYVYGAGTADGYEVEVYKKNGVYYSVSTPNSYVAGPNATVYEVYDCTGNEWKAIGYYTGKAMAVNYSTQSSANSFATNTWYNTENYGHGTGLTLSQCVYYTVHG